MKDILPEYLSYRDFEQWKKERESQKIRSKIYYYGHRKYISEIKKEYHKKRTDCRNNNLDPDSAAGKGYISEVLVSKFLGIKSCFDLTGNFNYPKYDMLEHEDWGLINVKGSKLLVNGCSLCHQFSTNKNRKPDFFFCIGYNKNRKHVMSVYIIPNEDYVNKLTRLYIPYNRKSKWDVFKESEEEVNMWDNIFHGMKLENCPVLRTNQKI